MLNRLLCIVVFCSLTSTYAQTVNEDTARKIIPIMPNNNAKYNYYYRGETVKQSLQIYAKNNMLKINFSKSLNNDSLKKTVSGQFSTTDNNGLLDILSKQYGFEWFIYSDTLYIMSNKFINKSIEVAPEDMSMVKSNLIELGLYNSKFGYSELPAENRIIINGPEQYTNMLIQQIKSLNIAPTNQQFAVYKLKYANASDIQLDFNNRPVNIPGVATILQNILSNNIMGYSSNGRISEEVLSPIKNQATPDIDLSSANSKIKYDPINRGSSTTPMIQADRRLNAVIVRDKSSNLKIYKDLIKLLDVQTPVIQIEVLIIRLDQDALSQQGVNWAASIEGFGGVGFGVERLKNPVNNKLTIGTMSPNGNDLFVNNRSGFIANLQFLEDKNIAKTTGKPIIATLDNLPAIVNVTQSLLINGTNNSGNSQSQQAQINTALQITPHIIFNKNNRNKIQLSIMLQDGSLSEPTSSSISSILQSNINSQAILDEDQSILLAGYTKDASQKESSEVPYLSKIPLLGWLFKNETTKMHKLTTLYLVTPKIIWIDNNFKTPESVTIDNDVISTKKNIKINGQKLK